MIIPLFIIAFVYALNETTFEVNSKDKLNYSTRKSRVNGLNIDHYITDLHQT